MSHTREDQRLIDAAIAARANAYAPYSGFRVGAAALDDLGRLTSGANVENSSYGLTICAERVAVAAAISAGAKGVRAIAVVTEGGVAPCGACRQFVYEFGASAEVLLVDSLSEGSVQRVALRDLLPLGFRIDTSDRGPQR